ncbi:thiamine phosphate synthase [Hymenobacter cavernae]|uniref:Thiamine-phosphate synthase n=1 Tax=Hymenobacter cavernae TaxID=2044852 RepID=A0ABQ1TS58_9BACT|nr:thiamine phosphate synthase [Hymenobacter cavernae]GGF01216.1 thiamine-phosphate synthase [Hymenobacter cavernae]
MQISPLHYITDSPALADLACQGGVDWVQLRVKNLAYDAWEQLAREMQQVCRQHGAKLIINDNPQIAQAIGADGVHLGKQDMPPQEARAILGPGYIIGGTANTFADIEGLVAAGVDYIGLGPFRFTTTKQNLSPILGLKGYQTLLAQCRAAGFAVPIVGIGGIVLCDVEALRATGLHGIAVAGAVSVTADPAAAAAKFLAAFASLPASV